VRGTVLYNARFLQKEINTKAAWRLSQAALLLTREISRESIGCSLTIHRVESALLAERASWLTVPLTTIF
jgi:hypothetical protein